MGRQTHPARSGRRGRTPTDKHSPRWRVMLTAALAMTAIGGSALAAHALTGHRTPLTAGTAVAAPATTPIVVSDDELTYYLSISDNPDDTGATARAAALQAAGRDEALLSLARRYHVTDAASLPVLLSASPSSPTGVTYGAGSYDPRSLHSKTISDLRNALEKVLSAGEHPVLGITDQQVDQVFHADPAKWSSGSRTFTVQRLSLPLALFPDAAAVTAALAGGIPATLSRTQGASVTTMRISDAGAGVGSDDAKSQNPVVSPATQQQLSSLTVGGHTVPTIVDGRWRVDTLTAVTTDTAAALERSRAGIRAQLLDTGLDHLVDAELAHRPVRLAAN